MDRLPGRRSAWADGTHEALPLDLQRGAERRLAVIALRVRGRIRARNRALLAGNLQVLEPFFARHADRFEWYRPDGGCIAYPCYKGPEGVERWAAGLVERTGVLLLPASIFASQLTPTPTDRFRIGYGRAHLEAGLTALEADLLQASEARVSGPSIGKGITMMPRKPD